MQNVNEKFQEEGVLEESKEDSFYNMSLSCMHSFF